MSKFEFENKTFDQEDFEECFLNGNELWARHGGELKIIKLYSSPEGAERGLRYLEYLLERRSAAF